MTEEECECEFGWTCPLCAPTGYRSRDKSKDDPLGIRFIAASPTTDAPTLAQFLLARVESEESEPFDLPPYECPPGCCAPAGWVGHHCHICRTVEYGGTVDAMQRSAEEHAEQIHQRTRVLAQCAATRQIVEGSPPMMTFYGPQESWVLKHLAAPFAAHPEFDPAWSV